MAAPGAESGRLLSPLHTWPQVPRAVLCPVHIQAEVEQQAALLVLLPLALRQISQSSEEAVGQDLCGVACLTSVGTPPPLPADGGPAR